MTDLQYFKDANVELKEMLKQAVHFGHYKEKWDPKMDRFIYGIRKGVHIIDLHKTLQYMDAALVYLKKMIDQDKTVLFVSTKQQANPIVTKVAKNVGMPYITYKWIPGFLTNFKTVSRRIKKLHDLREMRDEGGLEKYTKKEALKIQKEIAKLEETFGGVSEVNDLPDCLFVVDTVRDHIAVTEANKLGIPVVAILDSNSDPDLVHFPIPGNDDAIKSLKYIMGKVEEALTKSKK